MSISTFPNGWKKYRIGDIAEIVSGATPKTKVKKYWDGNILWATPKDLGQLNSIEISDTERKITKVGYESCSTKLLPPGSVLLSSRAPIGHLAINTKPMCTNQGFKSLIPQDDIFNRYLYWVLKSSVTKLRSMGRGCTFDELSKGLLASLEIPVPPLDEQRRIVARIEELTRRVEEARQILRKIEEELISFTPTLLSKAFRGEL
jgi:type I restriction enzyme, S subunit